MRKHDMHHSNNPTVSPRHPHAHPRVRYIAWEAFLILSLALLSFVVFHQWQTVPWSASPQPHDVLITAISAAGALLSLWNISNAAIARLTTMRSLPASARRLCISFVERWGTGHARRILLHSGVKVAVGVSALTMGFTPLAFAADLPTPDVSAAETPMSAPAQTLDSEDSPSPGGLPSPLLPGLTPADNPQADDAAQSMPTPSESSTSPSVSRTNPVAQDARRRMEQAIVRQHATAASTAPPAASAPTPTGSTAAPRTPLSSAETASATMPQPQARAASQSAHTVSAGECLWSIAADLLPENSSDADIARMWQEIYSLNLSAVGPSPDIIMPGTVLTLPTTR